ncbi:MAG TPA: transaldolase [Spirochaetes bacterium]|nr:transaldolase [Spirochaetota bacterium]
MKKMQKLSDLGQAVWFDNINRSFIANGELKSLIDEGLRGVTSNPTIFEKSITGSTDYDRDLIKLVREGKSAVEIYETLVLEDISSAADILLPVYEETGGLDGYVSVEVNPELAGDTEGTIAEADRLFKKLGRPNVMIKVPATEAGIPAIRTLVGRGININVTLIFSLGHYNAVAEAYISGLDDLESSGGNVSKTASVASFFISRVDTAVDRALEGLGEESLMGKIAIANAKAAYARFKDIFSGERWQHLVASGARVQRALWASTGTKNPNYSDTLYVDNLIGADTVNTVPPATLDAFLDHGTVEQTIDKGAEEARKQLGTLSDLGINLGEVARKLQDDGVDSFAKSFEALMESIHEKRERLLGD